MSILEAVKDKVLAKFPDQTTYPNKTKDLLDYCDKVYILKENNLIEEGKWKKI